MVICVITDRVSATTVSSDKVRMRSSVDAYEKERRAGVGPIELPHYLRRVFRIWSVVERQSDDWLVRLYVEESIRLHKDARPVRPCSCAVVFCRLGARRSAQPPDDNTSGGAHCTRAASEQQAPTREARRVVRVAHAPHRMGRISGPQMPAVLGFQTMSPSSASPGIRRARIGNASCNSARARDAPRQ